jgi:hypothetical protein
MKSSAISPVANRQRSDGRTAKAHFATQTQFPGASMYHCGNQKFDKNIAQTRQIGHENVPASSLWVNKIGNRVVGMARLVQDGPHSARIVLFRIDPEWSHTKIPVNLIYSIQSFCQNHGGLKVSMQPHTVPTWLLTLMIQHGFQFSKE